MLSKPGGKPLFFHDTDSGTVLFAQRSGVVGIAEQAGIVSHDEGGEDIQKLLFFQIVCFPKDSEINFFTSGSVPPKNNKVSQFANKVPAESLYNALICDLS